MNKFSKFRVHLARILLPFLTIWLCFLPSTSYALVPAAIGGYGLPTLASVATASGGATAAASIGAIDIFAAGALVAVGAAMSYYALDYMVGADKYTARIPLTSDPQKAVPAPNAPPSVPIIPSVTSPPTEVRIMSAAEAVQYDLAHTGVIYYAQLCRDSTQPCNGSFEPLSTCASYWPIPGSRYCGISISTVTPASCPSGYVIIGTTCQLADARLATPDKACDISRTGSALEMISDPDCAASGQAIPVICSTGGMSCSGVGLSPSGAPRSFEVIPRADGGSTVQTHQQQTVTGQTQVQTTTIGVTSTGVVDSVSAQVQAGNIPASPTGVAVAPVVNPTASVAQPQPNITPVTFPNDYARTGESQQAANTTNSKLDTIHGDLSATTALADPLEPVAGDMPGWGNTFTNLLSWHLPAHSSACPQPSFDLSGFMGAGKVFTFSTHCALVANNTAPIQTAMAAAFTIMALFIVLRA